MGKFPNGIYTISFCPFCTKPIYRYNPNQFNHKHFEFLSIKNNLFDYENLELKCYNEKCINYNKIAVVKTLSVLIINRIKVDISVKCNDKIRQIPDVYDSKNDVKLINVSKISQESVTYIIKYFAEGCNIIVKRISSK